MRKSLSFVCLLLELIFLRVCSADDVLEDVVTAIEKGIHFYSNNYAEMNIDGIFGLRVLEGQLKLVANYLKNLQHHSDDLQQIYFRIASSYRLAKSLSNASLLSLKESDAQYYKLMGPVIHHAWSVGKDYRHLDPHLKWKNELSQEVPFDEKLSDKCMSELLGTQTGTPCSISNECVIIMSTPGLKEYKLTHQLLYSMLAEQSGCTDVLNSALLRLQNRSISVEQLQAEFCVNNFYETSRSVLKQNGIITEHHDLFLEQELICTMLGYVEFLHIDWLEQIISWQMPSGCFERAGKGKTDIPTVIQRRKSTPFNKPTEAMRDINFRINDDRATAIGLHLPFDKRMPFEQRKQMGNLGSLNQITPLIQKEPTAAIRVVDRDLKLRKTGHRSSRIHRAVPNMKYTSMEMERGKLGEHIIRAVETNRKSYERVINGSSQHLNYNINEQGKVGDTHVMIKKIVGKEVGEQETVRDKLEIRPLADQDTVPYKDSFKVDRQINRKLLYEKILKNGCLSHKTAVAMGALTQYLRFIVLANSSKYDALKHLYGTNYLMHPTDLLHLSDASTSSLSKSSSSYLFKPITSNLPKNFLGAKATDNFVGNVKQGAVIVGDDEHAKNDADRLSEDANRSRMADVEMYEDDDSIEALPTSLPIVKSDEDELMMYDELLNTRAATKSGSRAVHQNHGRASHVQAMFDSSFEGVTSISSTYGFVIIVTALILLLLYRSLRKHRFGVQYRQSRWR